eukprot:4726455-Alexandrium_andersonii.AAC.1
MLETARKHARRGQSGWPPALRAATLATGGRRSRPVGVDRSRTGTLLAEACLQQEALALDVSPCSGGLLRRIAAQPLGPRAA